MKHCNLPRLDNDQMPKYFWIALALYFALFEPRGLFFNQTRPVWTGFKIVVRPKLLKHNKTKLYMGFKNLIVIDNNA